MDQELPLFLEMCPTFIPRSLVSPSTTHPISGLTNENCRMKRIKYLFLLLNLAVLMSISGNVNGEKVVMVTDREVYVAGDRLFFSLLQTSSAGQTSDYGYITLMNATGNHLFNGLLKYENYRSYGSIYLADTLVTGIYQLVSYTNFMRNTGDSCFARKNILVVNRFDKQLTGFFQDILPEPVGQETDQSSTGLVPRIILSKNNFLQRENLMVSVNIPANPNITCVALTIRQKAPLAFQETKGKETPGDWQGACTYLPERNGIILQGRVLDENRKPLDKTPVFLSCHDTAANLQHTVSGQDGAFRFFLNPGYFGKMISLKSENSFRGTFETDDKFQGILPAKHRSMTVSGDILRFMENNQNYLTIQKSYNTIYQKEVPHSAPAISYLPLVYPEAPLVVYPSDFVYLSNFQEISREIIPLLKTREKSEGFVASVINLNQGAYTRTHIYVDGVLIEEVSQIMHFDSKILKKIEVVPNNRYVGELEIPGILSVNTTTGEAERLTWKYPVVNRRADLVMPLTTFKAPDTAQLPGYLPDFRPLLLWEPLPPTQPEFTFQTAASDCTGEFEVVLSCADAGGNMLEIKKSFFVNRK